jgi:hypothetical protein
VLQKGGSIFLSYRTAKIAILYTAGQGLAFFVVFLSLVFFIASVAFFAYASLSGIVRYLSFKTTS